MKIKVFFIHHIAAFSGPTKSLIELRKMLGERISATVLCPSGASAEEFKKNNFEVLETKGLVNFNHSRHGYYKWLRWVVLFRELLFVPFTLLAILKYKEEIQKSAVIHANEITLLPTLAFLKLFTGNIPVVIHTRSVQENSAGPIRRLLLRKGLSLVSKKVIAIDQDALDSLPDQSNAEIIYNSLHISELPSDLNKTSKNLKILFIGNLLYHKGIIDLVECAKLAQKESLDISFQILGPHTSPQSFKDTLLRVMGIHAYATKEVHERIKDYGLKNIEFLGFDSNIVPHIQAADLICFPSHLDAVGRPTIEGALLGKASIIALTKTSNDVFVDQRTGLSFEPKNIADFYRCCKYFYDNPEEVQRMGLEARKLASEKFDLKKNADKVYSIYQELIKDVRPR